MLDLGVLAVVLGCVACDGVFSANGLVVDSAGRALSGVEVSAYRGDMRVVRTTDEHGCFSLFRVTSPKRHMVPLSLRVDEREMFAGELQAPSSGAENRIKIIVTNQVASIEKLQESVCQRTQ